MFDNEVFIPESSTVNGFSTSAISSSDITTLSHEVGNNSMENTVFVVQFLSISHTAFFSSTECSEVFSCFRCLVCKKLNYNSSSKLTSNWDVEEDFGFAIFSMISFLFLNLIFQLISKSQLFLNFNFCGWFNFFFFISFVITKLLSLKIFRSSVFFQILLFWPRFCFHSWISTIIFKIFCSIFNILDLVHFVFKQICCRFSFGDWIKIFHFL